ncbi:MAG: DUF4230 domain-containing protein [Chloroflexota bacterium]|nr:MAG: DUF4230 domain-containing protein [Chloroflexota bacterium]
MKNSSDSNLRSWVLVIGILFILSIIALAVIYAIQQSTLRAQQLLQPVTDMTGSLGTQVSQVLNPTPTIIPDPITIIQEIRALARLETIQYTVEKVITAETGQGTFGFLFGDRLLFVAHGIVIAGIDMGKLGPEHLQIREGVLYVTLPPAELFIATLDNEKSYVYDRDTGALTKGDVNLETSARQAAEQEIAKAALEDGILEMARQNGESYLYRLFMSLGYQEVIFVQPTPTP